MFKHLNNILIRVVLQEAFAALFRMLSPPFYYLITITTLLLYVSACLR